MKLTALISIISLACILLFGCSGGSNSLSSNTQTIAATGRAVFTVVWPPRTRLIPEASNSIRVDILQGTQLVISKVLVRPASGGSASAAFDALPPGSLTANVTASPQADGNGVAQVQASAPLVIQANKTSSITLTMTSTIDHLVTTPPSLSMQTGKTSQIIVTAYDDSQEVVLLAADKVTWKSDTPKVATVSSSGMVQSGVAGSAQITITETESGKFVKLAVTVTLAGGGGGGGMQHPWGQLGQNAQHIFRGLGQGAAGNLKWTANLQQLQFQVNNTLRLNANGLLFLRLGLNSPFQDYLAAVDSQSGAITWKSTFPNPDNGRLPALGTNGLIYICQNHILYALDQTSGTQTWTRDFGVDYPGDMVVGPDNTLYLSLNSNQSDYRICALNGANGSTIWTSPTINSITFEQTCPALGSDGTVYVGASKGTLYALNGTNGNLKWTFSVTAPNGLSCSMPSIGSDGTLYFVGPSKVYALKDNGTSFTEKWEFPITNWINLPPAIGPDGTVYIEIVNHLYALDGATGAQKWNVNFDLNSNTVTVDNAGTVYAVYSKLGDTATYLGAFNGQNGGKLWEYATSPYGGSGPASPPIIGPDGILYMSDSAGGLIAVQ